MEFNKSPKTKYKRTGENAGAIVKRGMAEIDVKEFISAFAVLIVACIIPYVVRVVDVFILVLQGINSQNKRGSYTFGELLTQDFNQPMNLAYIMVANYLLYIIVFGLWYQHLSNRQYNIKATDTAHAPANAESKKAAIKNKLFVPLLTLFKTPVPYLLILAGCFGQLLVDSVLNILRDIFPRAFEEYDALVSNTVGPTSSTAMLIAVFILAPIGEEFLFRGLIQGKLKKAVNGSPMPTVILLQGLLFGVYHGNLIQGIYAFFLGALLGLIAYQADNLLPCIIFHMALNSSVCLVSESWFTELSSCIIVGIISLAVFVPSIVITLKYMKKKKTQDVL
jgi:membrane protease YdiL (CAAX protease family)